MKSLFALLLSFILIGVNASACINEYYRSSIPFNNGQLDLKVLINKSGEAYPYWYHGIEPDDNLLSRKDSLQKAFAKKPGDFRLLADYAALELKTGNKTRALEILEKLYAEHPNEYNIVVNLGTAYELKGNNSKALELIKKAVSLNPSSHFGSEWIHVNILEQKNSTNPDYSKIIGLGIKNFPEWLTDRSYKFPVPADTLKLQIAWQLHERIAFVAAPDDIVGRIVIDFADIVAKTVSYNEAIPFYEYGANYGANMQKLADERKADLKGAQKEATGTLRGAAIIWGLPLLFIIFIVLAWIRNRRNTKSEA